MTEQQQAPAVAHARHVVHEEERGDYYRTCRSGVYTKLGAVRQHDHGKQNLASHKVVHTVVHTEKPNDPKTAYKAEHEIDHVHEHRTMLSGHTL